MTQLPPLLTAAQVAARFDTTDETIRRWVRQGKLSEAVVVLPSGRVKFRREVIDEIAPLDEVPA